MSVQESASKDCYVVPASFHGFGYPKESEYKKKSLRPDDLAPKKVRHKSTNVQTRHGETCASLTVRFQLRILNLPSQQQLTKKTGTDSGLGYR